MSLESWKDEFYKVDASEVPAEDALEHSFLKWEGLRQHNLEAHGLHTVGGCLVDSDGEFGFVVDDTTCALCAIHLKGCVKTCVECPLFAVREETCDRRAGYEMLSPYGAFTRSGDPEPMLALILAAIERGA